MKMRLAAGVCLAASLAAHGAGLIHMIVPDNSLAAEGPPPAMVQAGNSFADMVRGEMRPPTPEITEEQPVDDVTDPPDPAQETAPVQVRDQAHAAQPEQTQQAEPDDALAQVAPSSAVQLEAEQLIEHAPDIQASVVPPVEHAAPQAVVPQVAALSPVVMPPAEPVAVQPTTTSAPQVLEALPDVEINEVTAQDVRPPNRPANLGQAPPPRQTTRAPQQQRPSTGNAQQDANRGAVTSRPTTGQATQQGQGRQPNQAAVQAARQAAAAYPNVVMRRISRVRRQNTRIRGVAVVAFRIGSGGQLTSVSVGRSSGSAELDRIAINHVRRAAPFPPPPSGARTSFSVQIQGR